MPTPLIFDLAAQSTEGVVPGPGDEGSVGAGGSISGSFSQQASGVETRESRTIIEDLQRRQLTHRFAVNGSPNEAFFDASLSGFERSDAHPWQDRLGEDMFIINRTFQALTDLEDRTRRKTLVEVTYQQRICPSAYEEDETTAMESVPVWYSPESPYQLLNPFSTPLYLPMPHRILRLHWINVALGESRIDSIASQLGKLNHETFRSKPKGYWLFEAMQYKKLYGSDSAVHYELTLTFRGDPWRLHKYWYPSAFGRSNPILPPTPSGTSSLESLHVIIDWRPKATISFDDLVPTSKDGCRKISR